jgi:hypothetical protein
MTRLRIDSPFYLTPTRAVPEEVGFVLRELRHLSSIGTIVDLERAVRALCECFKTDAVVIVGSQAILAMPRLSGDD